MARFRLIALVAALALPPAPAAAAPCNVRTFPCFAWQGCGYGAFGRFCAFCKYDEGSYTTFPPYGTMDGIGSTTTRYLHVSSTRGGVRAWALFDPLPDFIDDEGGLTRTLTLQAFDGNDILMGSGTCDATATSSCEVSLPNLNGIPKTAVTVMRIVKPSLPPYPADVIDWLKAHVTCLKQPGS